MDPDILERFHSGDESALRALYDRYGGPVLTVTMSILRDRELAADAVQQTFLKAWRAADDYDPARDFGSWIYAIARRTAVDMWRRERRRPGLMRYAEKEPAITPRGIEGTWEAFEVRGAIDRLTPEEREVIRLTHFIGLTHAQASERLGIPIGTVKSRSHRAHTRLAALLKHLIEK